MRLRLDDSTERNGSVICKLEINPFVMKPKNGRFDQRVREKRSLETAVGRYSNE